MTPTELAGRMLSWGVCENGWLKLRVNLENGQFVRTEQEKPDFDLPSRSLPAGRGLPVNRKILLPMPEGWLIYLYKFWKTAAKTVMLRRYCKDNIHLRLLGTWISIQFSRGRGSR